METMKDMFAESMKGLRELIMQQVTAVEEDIKNGRKCRVTVSFVLFQFVRTLKLISARIYFLAGGFAKSEYL
jgi:hypothetical protein